MTQIKGIYAASMSIFDDNLALDTKRTILHAESLIDNGCHGVAIFGSTGQAQLISIYEKIDLLNKLSESKYKENFIIGTGLNSLAETINLINVAISLGFKNFLIMPPAYYKYDDDDVIRFYSEIINKIPECKIILYNFEKLCGYRFSISCVENLVKKFPSQIVGVKDSSYNLYKNLKIDNFSVLPGTELKLLEGLKLGCTGIITATCNVTESLSRKVYDDFFSSKDQTMNELLCSVRKVFDNYNLISALHSFFSEENKIYKNILPPLSLLSTNNKKDLFNELNILNFKSVKPIIK